jgi:hypothetical protein
MGVEPVSIHFRHDSLTVLRLIMMRTGSLHGDITQAVWYRAAAVMASVGVRSPRYSPEVDYPPPAG